MSDNRKLAAIPRTPWGVAIRLDGRDNRIKEQNKRIFKLERDRARLVAALRELLADCAADMKPTALHPARILLREIGEAPEAQ